VCGWFAARVRAWLLPDKPTTAPTTTLHTHARARYELAMELSTPASDYPMRGAESAEAFAADLDADRLRERAGALYAEVTLGLLAFEAGRRMSLAEAAARLRVGGGAAQQQAQHQPQHQAQHQTPGYLVDRQTMLDVSRGFSAIESFGRVLGQGCNGAVIECVVAGEPVALKVMYNYGQTTTLVLDVHATEYRFLSMVPYHYNVVAVRGVIPASPLTPAILALLPEEPRAAGRRVNAKTKQVTYLSTAALVLERLPKTLEQHVKELGTSLGACDAAALGVQVAAALLHLRASGVEHGDLKLDNLMVDPARDPPRVVLVDFGCAVMRGARSEDMDERMEVHATRATALTLGNPAHLAPEVLAALKRKGELARESAEVVVVPLAQQSAFALGVVLFELAMGLEHPLGHEYPAMGACTREAFGRVDLGGLQKEAGHPFAAVVRGLLAFEPRERMSLGQAHRELEAIAAAYAAALGSAHATTAVAAAAAVAKQ
jgi:hypothetical protein